jgi:hypothetical protein
LCIMGQQVNILSELKLKSVGKAKASLKGRCNLSVGRGYQ